MHSTWFSSAFLRFVKFCQIKEGDLISSGDPILQNGWIIWSPILCFNFRNLKEPNSSSFIRFQFILNDSAVLFSTFWNFVKIKRVVLFLRGIHFCRTIELFGPHFCVSILEIWRTQVLRHSLDFNVFYMIQQCFSQVFEISPN